MESDWEITTRTQGKVVLHGEHRSLTLLFLGTLPEKKCQLPGSLLLSQNFTTTATNTSAPIICFFLFTAYICRSCTYKGKRL